LLDEYTICVSRREECWLKKLLPVIGCLLSLVLPAQSQQTTEPRYGGFYHLNFQQIVRSLDPVLINDVPSQQVANQIYDRLVDYDSNLTLIPELAERWEVSGNGLTYTYHLRKGVRFHDSPAFPGGKGREMKAADVKYCFDRILDANSGTLGDTYFRGKVKGAQEYFDATRAGKLTAGGVSGFRIVDDYSFAIDLIKPFAPFKHYPAFVFCCIYPPEAIEYFGAEFSSHPVGTGPFIVDRWDRDVALVLRRNPSYWQSDDAGHRLPYLDSIRFSSIRDGGAELAAFTSGSLEESNNIPFELLPNVVSSEGQLTPEYAQFVLSTLTPVATNYYGMLTTRGVFRDVRVRKAFNYAIDRKKVVREVLKGEAVVQQFQSFVPPSIPGYTSIGGYDYNLDSARALMAAAGYPGGKGFPAITLQLNEGGGRNQRVAEGIQEMLASGLGIEVKLQMLHWAQHLALVEDGKTMFWRSAWIADYPDAENFLQLLYGKMVPKEGGASTNTTRYRNHRFDNVFEEALRTQDDEKRNQLYAQAEEIALRDAPVLPLFYYIDYRLLQPYVRGYSAHSPDRRELKWVWFEQ
jgi:oligopeptide transport system substrate-binding protein